MARSGRDQIVQRIALEGAEAIKRQLAELGVTGERAIAQITAAAAASNASLSTVSGVVGGLTAAFGRFTAALGPVGANFRRLNQDFGNLEQAASKVVTRLGLLAAGIGAAGVGLFQFANRSAKAVDDLEDAADALGLTSKEFLAFKVAAAQGGDNFDKITAGLARFQSQIGALREKQMQLNGTLGETTRVLRGNGTAVEGFSGVVGVLRGGSDKLNDSLAQGVDVLRGGRESIQDLSNPLARLKINLNEFSDDAEGNAKLILRVAQELEKMGDTTRRASIAQQAFGRGFKETIPFLTGLAEKLLLAKATLKAYGLEVADLERNQVKAFQSSLALTQAVVSRVLQQAGNTIGTVFVPLLNAITKLVGTHRAAILELAQQIVTRLNPSIEAFIALISDPQKQSNIFTTLSNAITVIADGLNAAAPVIAGTFRVITAGLQLVAEAFNSVFGTQLNAVSVIAILVIGKISGAFALIRASVGIVITVFRILIGVVAAVAAAFEAPVIVVAAVVAAIVGAAAIIIANWSLIRDTILGAISAIITGTAAFFDGLRQLVNSAVGAFIDLGRSIYEAIAGAVDRLRQFIVDGFNGAINFVIGLWNGLVNVIALGVQSIIQFFQPLIDTLQFIARLISNIGSSSADVGATGFARGGMVHGPGSSTSDSILARLSAGEFVMTARAVQHWGPRFFAALNRLRMPQWDGFSLGGLVDGLTTNLSPAPLRFAAGGMVPAIAAGTVDRVAVDLRFDGEVFADMLAPRAVAEKLVRYARGAQMRSAGKKPDWYGRG